MWSKMISTGKMRYYLPPDAKPKYCSPVRGEPKFTEGVQQDDFRIIQDLRKLNVHLQDRVIKYETAADLPLLADASDAATSVDFSKFFYSFPLAEQDWKYTCCRAPLTPHPRTVGTDASGHPIDASGLLTYLPGAYYVMTCLPMGLSLSPFVVLKCTRWVIAWVRRQNANVLWFVDDVLLLAARHRLRSLTHRFCQLVQRLGLILNPDKGWKENRTRFTFLGIGVDLARREFFIPPYKLEALTARCRQTLMHARSHGCRVPARAVARLTGTAVSLMLASPILPLFLRSLHDVIRTRGHWTGSVYLTHQALTDIRTLSSLGQLYQWAPFAPPRTRATIFTDASTRGYGGHGSTPTAQLLDVSGMWDTQHTCGEINRLELQAVILYLRANQLQLHGLPITLRSDNSSVVAVCNRHSSRSTDMMGTYRELYTLLRSNGNTLQASHITTLDNWRADTLSRTRDATDFCYNPALLAQAEQRWDVVCTVDRFASSTCHQALPYESRYPCSDALRTDTFTATWHGMAWLTPPLALMASTLQKVELDNAPAVLVCPDWEAAPWYPRLQRLQQDSFPFNTGDMVTVHPNNPAFPEVLRNHRWKFRVWLLLGTRA
jgi:hypothetical protein